MFLAKIANNGIVEYPYTLAKLRADWPGTGFPDDVSDCDLSDFGAAVVLSVDLPEHAPGDVVEEGAPALVEGKWRQTWIVRPKTEGEKAADAQAMRTERDRRLLACDWTQTADAPLDDLARAAWAAHRQALRDITDQPGFPWSVVWPADPAPPYAGVVPNSITRYQGLAQLADTPIAIDGQETDALTVIESIMPTQPRSVQIAFNEASVWLRHSPMVLSFAVQFGWDEAEVDQMFRAAVARTA